MPAKPEKPAAVVMERVLELAGLGVVSTHPNPRVGCVIIDTMGRSVEGYHRFAGGDHAEIVAIKAAREKNIDLNGAIAYVNLEPCSHQGKTGPCCEALIDAGIKKVVVAIEDPNPLVKGRGLERLRDAGVEVLCGVLSDKARALNKGFIKRMEQGLPYTRLKLAMSIDGKIALANGQSQWISGEASRSDVQTLRAQASTILTGMGTVTHDNPRLTVRDKFAEREYPWGFGTRQPKVAIVDKAGELKAGTYLAGRGDDVFWFVAAGQKVDSAINIKPIEMPLVNDNFRMHDVLQELAKREVNDLLVEAGPGLAGALLQESLVDELIIYMAPKILGNSAQSLVTLPELTALDQAQRFVHRSSEKLGGDLKLVFERDKSAPENEE